MSNIKDKLAKLSPEQRKLFLAKLKKGANKESRRIPQIPRNGNSFPLSYSQERIYFLETLEPGSAIYNIPFGYKVDGNMDIGCLEKALSQLVKRHESLRTSFSFLEGQPVQVISNDCDIKVPVIDLSHLSENEKDTAVNKFFDDDSVRPFNLETGPLFRAHVLKRRQDWHLIVVCIHHIIADGASIGVFSDDLAKFYEAAIEGRSVDLPELAIQYVDFAVWQRGEESRSTQTMLDYWRNKLSDLPVQLHLPTDRPHPAVQTFSGDYHLTYLPEDLSGELRQLCKKHSCTLFICLLAIFKVFLHKFSGQKDIVVGSPIDGRNRDEVGSLVGMFVNNLVLRTIINDQAQFSSLLTDVKKTCLEAFSNQDITFERLVEEVQPERNLSITPLFQVMLIMLNTPNEGASTNDLQLSAPKLHNTNTSKFDLTLYVNEEKSGISLMFEYNTDLFNATTIERMGGGLLNLIKMIVAKPDTSILQLSPLSHMAFQEVMLGKNQTERSFALENSVIHLFEARVKEAPDRTALVFGERTVSYQDLDLRVRRLAARVRETGVQGNELIGVCVERSIEMVVAVLGVMKAGAAYVPLDPAYPAERITYMIEDAGLKLILTDSATAENLNLSALPLQLLQLDDEAAEGESADIEHDFSPDDKAYVIYTSGSTGKPKGVVIQHKALTNFLLSMQEKPGLSHSDNLLAVTTLSFDIAALELYLPLISGGAIVLADRESAGNAHSLAEILQSQNITVMQATPATWRMIDESDWPGNSDLKILCGGEAMPLDLARSLVSKSRSVWNMYGPTETAIWSSVLQIDQQLDAIYIGGPIANTQFYILDKALQPTPIGVFGELYIGGAGLAAGYLNRKSLTEERFVENPFRQNSSARLYKTGDLARHLDSGVIEFGGRVDYQVKVRGFRIELGEIESMLISHKAVAEAVVVAKELGVGDTRLISYLIYKSEDEPTGSELRKYLKTRLPDYMVPSFFVPLDKFPLTPNEKIDRKKLPLPNQFEASGNAAHEPPVTEAQIAIAEVWTEVLGGGNFSLNDNFFDMGGHSLLSMKVIFQIEKKWRLRLNPRELMFRSLGQIADLIAPQLDGKSVTDKTKPDSTGIFGRLKKNIFK